MPANWFQIDAQLPAYSPNDRPEEQIRKIYNYLYILAEQLRFGLQNLGTNNWNKKGLQEFSSETTKDVEKKIEKIIKQMSDLEGFVSSMSSKLNALSAQSGAQSEQIQQLLQKMENLTGSLDILQTGFTEIQTEIGTIRETQTAMEERLTAAEAAIRELQGGTA